MGDLTRTLLNIHCPKVARSNKRASLPISEMIEARFRVAKRDKVFTDTTSLVVQAAWTQGNLDAPKIGDLFAPQHLPIPDLTLAQWSARLAESPEYAFLFEPPQIFTSFASLDSILNEDDANPFEYGVPENEMEMAAEDEANIKKDILSEIERNTPQVWDHMEFPNGSTF